MQSSAECFLPLLFTLSPNLTPLHIGLSAGCQCRVPPPTHARSQHWRQLPVTGWLLTRYKSSPHTTGTKMVISDTVHNVILAGGEKLHVSVLRENIQDKCQLQEAHEDSHWQPHRSESNR